MAEFMFQNVAYRATVYRTGGRNTEIFWSFFGSSNEDIKSHSVIIWPLKMLMMWVLPKIVKSQEARLGAEKKKENRQMDILGAVQQIIF